LTLSVGAASALAFGCSAEDPGTTPGTGGSGGSAAGTGGSGGSAAGTGGTTGGTGGTTGGSGGTTGGTGGTTGGSGGTAGGSGGTTGGTGGATGGSGGSGGAPVTPNCSTQLKVFITANHMHTMMVTADDVMNGVEKIYDTTGGSDHPHWIKLTAADFTKLKTGGTVRKLACNHEHEHEYIINCVGNALPDQTSGVANYCDTNQPHTCGATNTDFCPELPDKP
jgi:hypothetical protein